MKKRQECGVNLFIDIVDWITDLTDWKLLLRSVPGIVTTIFVLSVVIMNLMANKTIIITNRGWLGITGGLFLSWIPFLCMDIVVKTYGARSATKLNILALLINLICVGVFQFMSVFQIGGDPNTYTAFNTTFSQTWQIYVASSVAFILSGVVNNYVNAGIGSLIKVDKDGKRAYIIRTYISTALGQFVDNFVFTYLAFMVFFKWSIGTTCGWSIITVLGASTFGAILELFLEIIFSPIGFRICEKWKQEGVAVEYLQYCRNHEVVVDGRRFSGV